MAAVMVKSKLRVSKHRRQLVSCNAPALLLAKRCFISFSADMLQRLLIQHYLSYDKLSRAAPTYLLPPIESPLLQLTSLRFYQLSGFWPVQFSEVANEMVLIPERIVCKNRVTASKELALFILLRRWKNEDLWEEVGHDLRRQRSWCICIYHEIFRLVARCYRNCVRVIDYRRVIPKFSEWSDKMVAHCNCDPDTLYFADGKPWKISRPGKGKGVAALLAAAVLKIFT